MSSIDEVFQRFQFEEEFPSQQITPKESLIQELESEIAKPLPHIYRGFLLDNGAVGPLRETEVPIPNSDDFAGFHMFLGFFRPEPNPAIYELDIREYYKSTKSILGTSFLPIAFGDGYLFALNLSSKTGEEVHCFYFSTEIQSYESSILLAHCFEDFVLSLQEFIDPY